METGGGMRGLLVLQYSQAKHGEEGQHMTRLVDTWRQCAQPGKPLRYWLLIDQ